MGVLFWEISQATRMKLKEYQERYKDKPILDLANEIAPWDKKPQPPKIPVEDMELEEIKKFMVEAPKHLKRVV